MTLPHWGGLEQPCIRLSVRLPQFFLISQYRHKRYTPPLPHSLFHRLLIRQYMCVSLWSSGQINPFTAAKPVTFPGWKMHGHAYKQHILRSYNTSIFNAMRFDENPSRASAKKKAKRLGFPILNFCWLFSSDIMAVKGLMTSLRV